ncbi:MAG: indolepyruvate oxidoreductase subunit beta [Planctomycetes bacterium]|nr:indolepyruvate oxidoreductase subunit beta [Planctomycetota bacterium]MBZ0153415.1 indolepyruvate oxidoreductase subunit beta [Planctomycetota bacterium]MCC7399790.1 indolepyruvate oxidoreductase subunit beta [Planctomycetota bacterium]
MRADVVLAGVGGQGVLTIARLLAEAAANDGFHVVQGELHGMSQRGGAVQAHFRLSDQPIESPQVPRGRADLLVGFEPLETLRNIAWLAPGGRIVTAIRPIENMPGYPPIEQVLAELRRFPEAILIDAHATALAAGSQRAENFVIAGAAFSLLPLTPGKLRAIVRKRAERWTEREGEAAIKALAAGRAAIGGAEPVHG